MTTGADTSSPSPQSAPAAVAQRPEVLAGAAFAGGWLLALILKRFAG